MQIIFLRCPDCTWLRRRLRYIKLCYLSLTFNSYSTYTELVFEPVITLVEFISRWFGFLFVLTVSLLISYVVITYYAIVIPVLLDQHSLIRAIVTILYGHYLLVMIVFHYYKAVTTDPGKPPKEASDRAVTSVCKRCILPKPPRTHHCSVCKTCILKMDHHCPWINNCVGHFNHRYFISFCIFMWLGTLFVATTTWPVFYDCFHVSLKLESARNWINSLFTSNSEKHDNNLSKSDPRDLGLAVVANTSKKKSLMQHLLNDKPIEFEMFPEDTSMVDLCSESSSSYKTNVIFLWLLCFAVTAALGTLTVIQFRLISLGETTIEKLINDKEHKKATKLGLQYQNPYNMGFFRNWRLLLQFDDAKSFVWNVIFPRVLLPLGDGLIWDYHTNKNYKDNLYCNGSVH